MFSPPRSAKRQDQRLSSQDSEHGKVTGYTPILSARTSVMTPIMQASPKKSARTRNVSKNGGSVNRPPGRIVAEVTKRLYHETPQAMYLASVKQNSAREAMYFPKMGHYPAELEAKKIKTTSRVTPDFIKKVVAKKTKKKEIRPLIGINVTSIQDQSGNDDLKTPLCSQDQDLKFFETERTKNVVEPK
jgi:hypothetical protein